VRPVQSVGAFLLPFWSLIASAFDETLPELVTDRPDQTESTSIIQPGYYQIETGVTRTEETSDEFVIEGPGTLIRIGMLERLELRLGWNGWIHDTGLSESGVQDAEIGAKLYLWDESGFRPDAALLAHLSIPVGDTEWTTDRVDPSFRFSFSHTLSDRLSLGYNAGMAWSTQEELHTGWIQEQIRGNVESVFASNTDALVANRPLLENLRDDWAARIAERLVPPSIDHDTLSVFEYTATVGMSLTERLSMYVELFGEVPLSATGGPMHYADGGFTFLVRDNLQLDLEGGVGLNDSSSDWFIGMGVSVRFPR
jgi:hypothetical protein